MKLSCHHHCLRGNALLVAMMLLFLIAAALGVTQSLTSGVGERTGHNGQFLSEQAAAEAGVEIMYGRLAKWVTANNGGTPSIADAARIGIPGNLTFPAITSTPTFPTGSGLANYTYSTFSLVPVLPDDTIITDATNARYLPDLALRASTAANSQASPVSRYVTKTSTPTARTIPSKSITYLATVTVVPKVQTVNTMPSPVTIRRYLRCDSVSPFTWLSYQNGRKNGGGGTYNGPIYGATDIIMSNCTFRDSVLYGNSANVPNDNWAGGGQAAQLHQVTPFALIPDIPNALANDASGNRTAALETSKTPDSDGSLPADKFSMRELIEPPVNPLADTTPVAVRDRRIYNQADARVKILVTSATVAGKTVKTVTESVVDVKGLPITAPWTTALLAAFTTKTVAPSDSTAFIDRSRDATQAVQVTDVNVGALKTVMDANPTIFPNGIIYAWDATGLDTGTRPETGMRLWNGGKMPDGGLVFGTNDPVYLRGDFNTGSTLKDPNNPESGYSNIPDSSNSSKMGIYDSTTASQRITSDYTVKPAAVFGDSVTELSNAWRDGASSTSTYASWNTINLIEGWSTMKSNELRDDDTYLDPYGQANPVWLEYWGGVRRTMSGEEMVLWHSRYNSNCNQGVGGGWNGDISYDANVSNVKLNWGSLAFVRDRYARSSN